MTDKRLFDIDPLTGSKRYFSYDDETDECTIQTEHDVSNLLELNKQRYNNVDEKARWGDGQLVASIPLPLYFDLKAKGIVDDPKKFKEWLNDSDNRHFRMRPGKV
jgi:hypothetical protein